MRTAASRLLWLLALVAMAWAAPASAADFPLKDGDIWVMAGDSITAQHLHSNYFEAFCFARYPKLKFAFRNSGVGGHTIPSTLARYDYDIGAWRPTVVSVELGMNDQGGTPTDKYIANMGTMLERIRSGKARPVLFTASPINNGNTMANLGGNKKLHDYAVALKEFAGKEKTPFADQFHLLVDIWGKNKPREMVARALPSLKQAAADDTLAGAEQLRAFLAAQEKSHVKLVSMDGDPVHPGAPGQLMMAAALLKELGAEPFVSSLTLDAEGKVIDKKGCTVDGAKAEDGKIVFDRTDECLPFPIPESARDVLSLYPTILDLSQYTLKVTGLKGDTYLLKINNVPVATVTAKELDKGINLTAYGPGTNAAKELHPIAAQAKQVLDAVNAKEGQVGGWRNLSKQAHAKDADPLLMTKLAEMTKQVEAADAKIRAAAKPQKLHFELAPTK
jgi:lysophospholipase L1-like esterase